MIEVIVPAVEPAPAAVRPALRLSTLSGVRIGFLNNGKPGTEAVFTEIARELRERYGVEAIYGEKPNAGMPAPIGVVDELSSHCHGIVTGIGD
jgi:hypothetical protein